MEGEFKQANKDMYSNTLYEACLYNTLLHIMNTYKTL